VVERVLLSITRQSFHLYGSGAILGTKDKRSNILIKDVPIALISQEIPRVFGICEPKTVDEDQMYISYKP